MSSASRRLGKGICVDITLFSSLIDGSVIARFLETAPEFQRLKPSPLYGSFGTNLVFSLDSPIDAFVVKFYRKRDSFIREWKAYELLSGKFHLIPELVRVEDPVDDHLPPFIVTRKLSEGLPLSLLLRGGDRQVRVELACQMGAALRTMHNLTRGISQRYGSAADPSHSSWYAFLVSEGQKARDAARRRPSASSLFARATELLLELAGHQGNRPPVLLHSDLTPDNLIVSRDGDLLGIIDFERCWFGPPEYDFAKLFATILQHNPELIDSFYQAYTLQSDQANRSQEAFLELLYSVRMLRYLFELDHPLTDADQARVSEVLGRLSMLLDLLRPPAKSGEPPAFDRAL